MEEKWRSGEEEGEEVHLRKIPAGMYCIGVKEK